MKFRLSEINAMKEPLKRLLGERIPMKAAFKLNRLIRAFEAELENIEAARIALIKEMGKPLKEDPTNFGVPQELVPEFQKKFAEFLKEEVEIDFEPIEIDSFADASISSGDMYAIEKLFTE